MLIVPFANPCLHVGKLRKIPCIALVALLNLCLISFPALAFDLDELSARLSAPATLQGRFEQRSWLEDQQTQLHSEGNFLYQRGIRVIWQMETPESIVHAFYADMTLPSGDEDEAEDEEADLMLAGRFAFAEQLAYLIAGDWSALSQYYRIDLEGEADAWQVHLMPLAPPLEAWLGTLILEGEERLDQITLQAANGDELIIQLQNQRALVDIGLQAFISQWFGHAGSEEFEEDEAQAEEESGDDDDEDE